MLKGSINDDLPKVSKASLYLDNEWSLQEKKTKMKTTVHNQDSLSSVVLFNLQGASEIY